MDPINYEVQVHFYKDYVMHPVNYVVHPYDVAFQHLQQAFAKETSLKDRVIHLICMFVELVPLVNYLVVFVDQKFSEMSAKETPPPSIIDKFESLPSKSLPSYFSSKDSPITKGKDSPVTDVVILTLVTLVNIVTIGAHRESRDQLKARAYNLFVADTFAWLSVVPSLFWGALFTGANSIHLGTMRITELSPFSESVQFPVPVNPAPVNPSAPVVLDNPPGYAPEGQ